VVDGTSVQKVGREARWSDFDVCARKEQAPDSISNTDSNQSIALNMILVLIHFFPSGTSCISIPRFFGSHLGSYISNFQWRPQVLRKCSTSLSLGVMTRIITFGFDQDFFHFTL